MADLDRPVLARGAGGGLTAVAAMPERTDVAIVGAGPAGLVLAHLLGQAGIPFIVAERQTYPDLGRRPKAGLIEYRTVQQLRAVGIAGTVLDFTARNHQCEFRTPAGSAVLDYGALTGGRPHYLYPQHQLVRRVAEPLMAGGRATRARSCRKRLAPWTSPAR
jgi:p-hydroxybenzoate 3-monooxygenase